MIFKILFLHGIHHLINFFTENPTEAVDKWKYSFHKDVILWKTKHFHSCISDISNTLCHSTLHFFNIPAKHGLIGNARCMKVSFRTLLHNKMWKNQYSWGIIRKCIFVYIWVLLASIVEVLFMRRLSFHPPPRR